MKIKVSLAQNSFSMFICTLLLSSCVNNIGSNATQEGGSLAKNALVLPVVNANLKSNESSCLSGELNERVSRCIVNEMQWRACVLTEFTIKNKCNSEIGLANANVGFSYFYKDGRPANARGSQGGFDLKFTFDTDNSGNFVGWFAGNKPILAANQSATFQIEDRRFGTNFIYDTDLANRSLHIIIYGPSFTMVESLPSEKSAANNSLQRVPVNKSFGLYSTMITNDSLLDMESGFNTSKLSAPFEYYDFNKDKDCRFKALKSGENCYLIIKFTPVKTESGLLSLTISSSFSGYNYESVINTKYSTR